LSFRMRDLVLQVLQSPRNGPSGQTRTEVRPVLFSASRNIRRAFLGCSGRSRSGRRRSWSRRRRRRTGDLGWWPRRRRGHSGRWRRGPRYLRTRTRRWWRWRRPAWWLSALNSRLHLRPRRGLRNRLGRRCSGFGWRRWRRSHAWLSRRFRNDRLYFGGLSRTASFRLTHKGCRRIRSWRFRTGGSGEIRGWRCRRGPSRLALRGKFCAGIRHAWNGSRRAGGHRRRPFRAGDWQGIGLRQRLAPRQRIRGYICG
jgi:hypothetical protein